MASSDKILLRCTDGTYTADRNTCRFFGVICRYMNTAPESPEMTLTDISCSQIKRGMEEVERFISITQPTAIVPPPYTFRYPDDQWKYNFGAVHYTKLFSGKKIQPEAYYIESEISWRNKIPAEIDKFDGSFDPQGTLESIIKSGWFFGYWYSYCFKPIAVPIGSQDYSFYNMYFRHRCFCVRLMELNRPDLLRIVLSKSLNPIEMRCGGMNSKRYPADENIPHGKNYRMCNTKSCGSRPHVHLKGYCQTCDDWNLMKKWVEPP